MDTLEQLNARLAPHDLAVMQQDNGRFSIWKIARGGVQVPGHVERYDGYRRIGRSYRTLTAAMLAAERALSR